MISKIQKNCIILHGCPQSEQSFLDLQTRNFTGHWIGYVKTELIMKGVLTKTPILPRAYEPNYEKFKYEMGKYPINENTILIGHSCSCAFLVKYLGETKKKANKLILVAPMKIAKEGDTLKQTLYNFEIDKSISTRVKEIVIFTSDTEEDRGKESAKIFEEALNAEVISIPNYGHYIKEHMQTDKFVELVSIVLK